jgi:predicted dehydrogenase
LSRRRRLHRTRPCGEHLRASGGAARLGRRSGTPFHVGFNRRYDPSHGALHDAIRAGDIGRTEMLILSSRDPEISPPDYVAAMPYGIFYDTMIHDFDMVRWLTGDEPVEIDRPRSNGMTRVASIGIRCSDSSSNGMRSLTSASSTISYARSTSGAHRPSRWRMGGARW